MAPSRLLVSALAITGALGAGLDCRKTQAGEPAVFPPWPVATGGNGTNESTVPAHVDSAHFRLYLGSATSEAQATEGLQRFEAAYDCFVGRLGFRSSGLSQHGRPGKGPYYKTEVFMTSQLQASEGIDGLAHYDSSNGRSWIQMLNGQLAYPFLSVHEYGHVLHWHQGLRNAWVEMANFRPWSEALANWMADTWLTSGDDVCGPSRAKFNSSGGDSIFEVYKVVGDSHLALVDATDRVSGNHYQAWPIFAYLFRNPDSYRGLGRDVVPTMLRQTPDKPSDETPLHVLQRMLGGSRRVQDVVARYWARMANGDIGHPSIQRSVLENKAFLAMSNFDTVAPGHYRVKPARAPQYMGASMAKLVMADGNTRADLRVAAADPAMAFTAVLSMRDAASGKVRYQTLNGGTGSVTLAASEDATLVVVNTPAKLLSYNPSILNGTMASQGLDYSIFVSGASVAMY